MKLPPLVDDLSKFEKMTGLLSLEALKAIAPKLVRSIDVDEDGGFETPHLPKLLKFVAANPTYHIISEVEDDYGTGVVYSNTIRYVNRLKYYIGNGIKTPLDCCVKLYEDEEYA